MYLGGMLNYTSNNTAATQLGVSPQQHGVADSDHSVYTLPTRYPGPPIIKSYPHPKIRFQYIKIGEMFKISGVVSWDL